MDFSKPMEKIRDSVPYLYLPFFLGPSNPIHMLDKFSTSGKRQYPNSRKGMNVRERRGEESESKKCLTQLHKKKFRKEGMK